MSVVNTLLRSLSLPLLLAACSPHPGAGEWQATGDAANRYSRLKVEFDGEAYLFVAGQEEHRVRCFWAGDSAETINMDCMLNDPSERRFGYQLRVNDRNQSTLLDNGKIIGIFQRR